MPVPILKVKISSTSRLPVKNVILHEFAYIYVHNYIQEYFLINLMSLIIN